MKGIAKLIALCALVLLAFYAPHATAQIPETSHMQVNEPLNVGGNVLQPGVYRVTLVPGFANRNQIQVTNEDRTKIYATVLSIPHALKPNEKATNTEFVYYPPVEGQTTALRTWFAAHPVSEGGHDIVYTKRAAMKLASETKEEVVAYATEPTTPEEQKTAELVVVTPTEEVVPYVEQPTQIAELPRTAGNTPLFAALGALLLFAAIAVRTIRTV